MNYPSGHAPATFHQGCVVRTPVVNDSVPNDTRLAK